MEEEEDQRYFIIILCGIYKKSCDVDDIYYVWCKCAAELCCCCAAASPCLTFDIFPHEQIEFLPVSYHLVKKMSNCTSWNEIYENSVIKVEI